MDNESSLTGIEINSVSKEILGKMIVAEQIALIREDLETAVLTEELPKNEWQARYEQIIAKYPRIQEYRPIINYVFQSLLTARDELDKTWTKYNPNHGHEIDKSRVLEATPQASIQLFSELFKSKPLGSVTAFRGAAHLRFTLSDKDMDRFMGGSESHGGMQHIPGVDYPVIVTRQSTDADDAFMAISHEVEHGKNMILENGKQNFIIYGPMGDNKFNYDLFSKLLDKNFEKPGVYLTAKGEILALFSYLSYFDQEQLTPVLSNYIEMYKKSLTDPSEGYTVDYKKYLDNKFDETAVNTSIKSGINSLIELYGLYKSSHGQKAMRIALNVLEQFSLDKWPAVVRLINQRRNNV